MSHFAFIILYYIGNSIQPPRQAQFAVRALSDVRIVKYRMRFVF